MEFKHTTLDNGLTLVAEAAAETASLAVGFFARTGSRDESDAEHGVSHYLEHMMFKGTERRSAFDVNREFDEMGANYNAFTNQENTVFYAAVLPEFQARAVDLLGDILRPSLRGEDFDTEKQVILEEIALYEDRPEFRLFEKLMSETFAGHPLGRSVLGTNASVTALTRDVMEDYFRRRYSPANLTVVAAGHLDWDALVEQIQAACGHWTGPPADRAFPEVPANRPHTCVTDPKLSRQHLGLAGRAPVAQADQRYAAQLLATILGDDTGSRLYYALIEPAIAEDASVTYDAMDRAGAMLTFITCDADRAAQALEIVRDEFTRFRDEGPTADELTAAKNKLASGAVIGGEVPMGRLTAVGFDWVYRRTYTPLAEQIDTLMAVTADEVLAVARDFDLNDTALLGLGPCEDL